MNKAKGFPERGSMVYDRTQEITLPFYEYKCQACGTVSEHLVGVGSDEEDVNCTKCGSSELSQLISLVSVTRGAAPEGCCGGYSENCQCDGACAHH